MAYSSVKIWYFSGTGNARFAANHICDTAKGLGYAASSHNIININIDNSILDKDSLLGFCYPTHGFNAPPVVLKFLITLPKANSRVFLLNTRAGMKLSKIHTAGLGGIALWLPMLILLLKGYKPVGFRPLDMPSNWISLHPGLKAKVVKSIQEHCAKTLESFTKRILNGKPVLNGLLWLPLDLAVAPIALLYYLFGRFALAKTFFASYRCNGCGACTRQCPVKAIVEKDGRPYWTFSCESCMKCMNTCSQRAIEIHHGFTFLLWWAAFSLLPSLFWGLLFRFDVISPEIYSNYYTLLHNAGLILIGFVVIIFGYKLLHWLLRYRFLNRIITYTSLTHYRFWRRYFLRN
jgi:ferredoxin